MGTLLTILTFGKSFFSNLFKFIIVNWKWVLPILIIVAGYFYVSHKIKEAHETGYSAGVTYERDRQQAQIDIENRKNREFENLLAATVEKFGRDIADKTAQRVSRERDLTSRVDTIIRDNTVYRECEVDPEVLNIRNSIRLLGPDNEK